MTKILRSGLISPAPSTFTVINPQNDGSILWGQLLRHVLLVSALLGQCLALHLMHLFDF